MASCLLRRNLTQMSFFRPLFSAKLVFFQKFRKNFLYLWNFVPFSLLSFTLLQNALVKSLLPGLSEFVNNFLFTICFGWNCVFYSLLQLSETPYIKRNLALPNKFSLLCHSQDPSTSDQSTFSLVFPNLIPHSLKNNRTTTTTTTRTWVDVQVHTQSLCPQLASLQLSRVPGYILLTHSCS